MNSPVETTRLTEDLEISRIVTGLWQVADMERGGAPLDLASAAGHLARYADAGFFTFDMADHYGSAELIAGEMLARHQAGRRPLAFTKWCPEPGPMTAKVVRAGIEERLRRLQVEQIDLLQLHWWSFEHPAWLDALHELARLREAGLIREIGVTNFDAAHLHLALADGVPVRTNQVSFSLIDRRATGALAEVCTRTGVRLLAYGTLCGGFLSERWLGRPRPEAVPDWSGMKYLRFIDAAGGWEAFQAVLAAASETARRHGVSIANVAARWVLDQSHVAAVIVGARLGEREHRADNARAFGFALDAEDRARLDTAFAATRAIPGDCGDEYRRPPYLTASGDLSHHLGGLPRPHSVEPVPSRPERRRVFSGAGWEAAAGYARAVRVGGRILVSGTTATQGADRCVAPQDAGAQAVHVLDKIAAAVRALGGDVEDILRTRVYLTDPADVEAVALAHGRVFGATTPANTLIVAGGLIGPYKVEIEAEAVVAQSRPG